MHEFSCLNKIDLCNKLIIWHVMFFNDKVYNWIGLHLSYTNSLTHAVLCVFIIIIYLT